MATTSDFRPGLVIKLDGELASIVDYQHVKPGKGGAFLKTRLKNLKTGQLIEKTFRSGEKIDKAYLEEKKCEYLYRTDDLLYFMDQANFEELVLTDSQVGDAKEYLKENTTVRAVMYEGELIGVELPTFVELEVVNTEPGVRGDTVSRTTKPAELETGASVQVPLFVNTGDRIKVDTREGKYVERVS